MRRHGEADQAFRRALDFNPNFALAHAFLGSPLATRGADEEAIRSAERAMRLSPVDGLVSAYASFNMVFAHFAGARYADGAIIATPAPRMSHPNKWVLGQRLRHRSRWGFETSERSPILEI
jgi:tetratricopeptide (TPR) repeat protein